MNLIDARKYRILKALKSDSQTFRGLRAHTGGSYTTLKKHLEDLASLGLVKVEKLDRFPFTARITITRKGLKALNCIEQLIKEVEG